MSKEIASNACPKTCGMLSTAAIFIAVGIIQLLAGIILLKSEYVYLLAGTDFMASVSNILVGCLLGVSASSWENKMKRMSLKNASRRNVLAGLYISVIAINSTTAIVMIMGDGNNLLTALAETTGSTSAKFVGEILACAYVTSVCSPIVCIVVAIVCLSGNRLELRDSGQSGKKRNKSVTKSESYGWVFTHRPKLMSDSHKLPSLGRTSSGDCAFLENQHFVNSSKRNPSSSLTEVEKPLKIWAQKRRKILEEITSPRSSVFSDNYLQFPEFTYGSYVETMLPRIKHTSLIRSPCEMKSSGHLKNESKSSDMYTSKLPSDNCMCQFSPKNAYAAINRRKKMADTSKYSGNSSKASLKDGHRQILSNINQSASRCDYDHEILQNRPRSKIPVNQTTQNSCQAVCGLFHIQCQCEYCNESSKQLDSGNNQNREYVFHYPVNVNQTKDKRTRSDTHSVSLESEASDSDSEINITENPLDYSANRFKNRLRSFKISGDEEQKQLYNNQNVILKSSLTEEELIHTKSNSKETAMAGTIIPINIRNVPNRTDSFPISADKLCNSETEENVNGELKNDYRILYSEISLNDVGLSANIKQCTVKQEDTINELEGQELKLKTQTEENLEKYSPTSVSKTKETLYNIKNYSSSIKDRTLNDRVATEKTANTQLLVTESEHLDDFKIQSKKQSAIRFPSIITGYPVGADGKTDISNLIMDTDSLLGLSEKELIDRTRRIRQLRKSVEIRSKEQKSLTINANEEE